MMFFAAEQVFSELLTIVIHFWYDEVLEIISSVLFLQVLLL